MSEYFFIASLKNLVSDSANSPPVELINIILLILI